jgi:UDP-glucose 4-epimerase
MFVETSYILITGGLGFIGSHICAQLLDLDYNIVIIDNLSNSDISVLNELKTIKTEGKIIFVKDNLNNMALASIFTTYYISYVIHLAGLKSVSESVNMSLLYYSNNVSETLILLNVMKLFNCKKIIFSSSATVYGNATYPVTEISQTGIGITNPYGKTKYFLEEILKDLYISDNNWTITLLRYFNPIGAHNKYKLGDNPQGIPNNLFPYILRVASGQYDMLEIFGNNYDTRDGTCIRDFIHVMDLADAHIKVFKHVKIGKIHVYNVGTGIGTSVLELIKTFEEINKIKINYKFSNKRQGDIIEVYADVNKIKNDIGWQAQRNIKDMCQDGWNIYKY